jgi:hypothetical protein
MLVDGTGSLEISAFLVLPGRLTVGLPARGGSLQETKTDGMEPVVLCCSKSSRSPFVTKVAAGLAVTKDLAFPTRFIPEKYSASYF